MEHQWVVALVLLAYHVRVLQERQASVAMAICYRSLLIHLDFRGIIQWKQQPVFNTHTHTHTHTHKQTNKNNKNSLQQIRLPAFWNNTKRG